ncbi:MAG: hypothetical protein COB15_05895 [Flavobacteriales bacterium]|nr:MAG: hypothetical protein COB15_05895 [Flavobacteriales bacterium]
MANSGVNYITKGELLTYHSFTETDSLLDVHAVFYSYFIFFSILILTYFYRNGLGIKNKYIIALMSLPLVASLVFAASKNVMVITFVTIVLYLFFILIKEIRWKQLVLVGVGLILALFMVAKLPMVKNRIVELTDFSGIENYEKIKNREKLTAPEREALNGTSLRLAFWYIGITEVFNHNRILLGLSPGDSKALLNFRYDELNLLPFLENYNMHNQFVQMFVEFGVVGLILYLCLITLLILASIKNRNLLMLIFVVGFLFFQLSESLLERNKGILFFVFFLLLLLKLNIEKRNENSNNWN